MGQQATSDLTANVNILDLVMTTKEASEKYDVADCTFRTWIKDGLFNTNDIKKSGSKWLIKRDAIEELLKKKNLLGKTFVVDGETVKVEYLGHKGKTFQIWYEDIKVKEIIEGMPHKELVFQTFQAFKEETKMNFKFVLIDGNIKENDNWFFRKEKVWALTLKGSALAVWN